MNTVKSRSKRSRNKALKTVVFVLALFLLLTVAALIYILYTDGVFDRFFPQELASSPVVEEESAAPASPTNTISFIVPDEKSFSVEVVEGESFDMPEGPQIEGYTFLSWLDVDGNIETRESFVPTENMYYSASYAVAFRDESNAEHHTPYMALDENAAFRPNDAITRGEMVQTFYSLLDLNGVGSGFFIDVDKADPLYAAAATLKDLDLIAGDRLHPEDAVTCGELFGLLEKLFPAPKEDHSFTNVPEGSEYYRAFCAAYERGWLEDDAASPYDFVARKDFARIVNLLTGRRAAAHEDASLIGTIVDVSPYDKYYADIVEALIEHEFTADDDTEVWTESTALPQREQGFFFLWPELRYIKENGAPAIDETVGSFYFDENGVYSSGDAALDELVRAKIVELVDPSMMSRDDMLKALYDFVLYDSFYLGGEKFAKGATGWEVEKAYQMLSTGKGNCYAYAATFWALSRAIGCNAVCYSGCVGTHDNPHAWVEIELDGTTYIFDPTLEYEQWYGPGTHTFERFFMKTYESVRGWSYDRGE